MKLSTFFSELKRRSVIKSTIAYLAVAWIIIQIASVLLPAFDAPDYVLKGLIFLLSFGLIVWVIVSWIYDLTPEGIRKTEYLDPEMEVSKLTDKRLNRVIAIALSVAVFLLVAISFYAGSRWDQGSDLPEAKKIAVVPFTQLDVEGSVGETEIDQDYFYFGMTEMLIDELSKVDLLRVVNRTSSKVLLAGVTSGNSLIQQVLNRIDYYVTGSIQRNSNLVDISLELRNSIDSEPIWKKGYSSDLSEIRSLWAQAASDLTSQMGIILENDDRVLWSNLDKVNPETFELYLKGKHYLNKSTMEDWQRGMVYMNEAIERNPADAHAYAFLAESFINLGHGPDPPPEVFPKALAAAKRAIQLDSTVALGWAALSHYHTYFGMDWALAEYAFRRANELNPNLADNHYHRAWYLALFGRMNEAIEEHKIAQELDPFTPLHTAWLGALYGMVGMYEEGLAEADKAAMMQDDYALSMFIRGQIYLDQGRTSEALETFKQASEINIAFRYLGYGLGLLKSGNLVEGKAILEEFESFPLNGYRALILAAMYSELGEFDKAFEYLGYENKHGWYPWIRILFLNDEMRKDPRFIKLIRDMNLPDPAPLVYRPET